MEPYLLGATCVAFNEVGEVLIACRRDPPRWELPGGFVDPGERFPEAAVREALEETGVTVEVHGLVGLYQHPSRRVLAGLFVATAISGTPGETEESSDARWVDVDTALRTLHPLYRPRLEDVLAARYTVPLRVHEGADTVMRLPVLPNAGRPEAEDRR
ncbi:NUDIX hydrolase [Streptomyces clavuligerus]|nr:NUDIX hydrolase [Streptomyces clavuligerus]